jgi:adenylate cyclase class 2
MARSAIRILGEITMTIEVEVKVKFLPGGTVYGILQTAKELGFDEPTEVQVMDRFYDSFKTLYKQNEFLRLRSVFENGRSKALLTHKGAKLTGKCRQEKQVEVSSASEMASILHELGYYEFAFLNKKQIMSANKDVLLTIDNVEGLGQFLEIEKPVEKEEDIPAALELCKEYTRKLLGPNIVFEDRSYLELLLEGNKR